MDAKTNKALEVLIPLLGVDINDLRSRLFIIRAIDYANVDKYNPNAATKDGDIQNQIFFIRATHYYKRMSMIGTRDVKLMKSIEEQEHSKVLHLKAMLEPQITRQQFDEITKTFNK